MTVVYLRVDNPAMNQAHIQQVEDCHLVRELEPPYVMKLDVHVYSSGQLGQHGDSIGDILVEIGSVLGTGTRLGETFLAVAVEKVPSYQRYQAVLCCETTQSPLEGKPVVLDINCRGLARQQAAEAVDIGRAECITANTTGCSCK